MKRLLNHDLTDFIESESKHVGSHGQQSLKRLLAPESYPVIIVYSWSVDSWSSKDVLDYDYVYPYDFDVDKA